MKRGTIIAEINRNGIIQKSTICALSLLKLHPRYTNYKILDVNTNTTNANNSNGNEILINTGKTYDGISKFDPSSGWFNFTFGPYYPQKLSAAGLVYKHFGREVVSRLIDFLLRNNNSSNNVRLSSILNLNTITTKSEKNPNLIDFVYTYVYNHLVYPIDALNTVNEPNISSPLSIIDTTTMTKTKTINLNKILESYGAVFLNTIEYVINIVYPDRLIFLKSIKEQILSNPSNKYLNQILVLPALKTDWRLHIYDSEIELDIPGQIKFVILKNNDKNYTVYPVPFSPDSSRGIYNAFTSLIPPSSLYFSGYNRIPFPISWQGLKHKILSQAILNTNYLNSISSPNQVPKLSTHCKVNSHGLFAKTNSQDNAILLASLALKAVLPNKPTLNYLTHSLLSSIPSTTLLNNSETTLTNSNTNIIPNSYSSSFNISINEIRHLPIILLPLNSSINISKKLLDAEKLVGCSYSTAYVLFPPRIQDFDQLENTVSFDLEKKNLISKLLLTMENFNKHPNNNNTNINPKITLNQLQCKNLWDIQQKVYLKNNITSPPISDEDVNTHINTTDQDKYWTIQCIPLDIPNNEIFIPRHPFPPSWIGQSTSQLISLTGVKDIVKVDPNGLKIYTTSKESAYKIANIAFNLSVRNTESILSSSEIYNVDVPDNLQSKLNLNTKNNGLNQKTTKNTDKDDSHRLNVVILSKNCNWKQFLDIKDTLAVVYPWSYVQWCVHYVHPIYKKKLINTRRLFTSRSEAINFATKF